jgi:hypothetical protein
MRRLACSIFAVVVLAAVACAATRADTVNVTLINLYQTVQPGGTVVFYGTLSAPLSNLNAVYLNGDTVTLQEPNTLMVDDSGLFANLPVNLMPSDSFTGDLFSITAPPNAVIGTYSAAYVLEGGADNQAQDPLALVNVTATVGATPERSSLVLLPSCALLVASAVWRMRRESWAGQK